MVKLLYTGKDTNTDENMERIRKLGYNVITHKDEKIPLNEDELNCEVLVTIDALRNNPPEKFRNLKFIQARMVGTDTIDMGKLKEMGVVYCNAKGVYDIPISEFVIMRILEIGKRMRIYEKQKTERHWKKQFDLFELSGKKAAVIGTGGIGVEIAKRLSSFNVVISGFNRSEKSARYFDNIYNIKNIKSEIQRFDIVIIAAPLDNITYHLFNDSMFELMKQNSILVNGGRGAIVEEAALITALKSGKLMGAAIDVFEREPLDKSSVLWELENFYYSPHNSFGSEENEGRMFNMVFKNLENYINNRELSNRLI